MKEIYIILSHTGTNVSNIIKLLGNVEYPHISIGFEKELDSFYSFGRINPYIAPYGGFIIEGINKGTFKRFKNTKCKVLKLEIADTQYELIKNKIDYMLEHKKRYKYDIRGLLLAYFNKKSVRKTKFYCSDFVKHMLDIGKIDTSKLPKIVNPEHFLLIDGLELVYEGLLRDYSYYEMPISETA